MVNVYLYHTYVRQVALVGDFAGFVENWQKSESKLYFACYDAAGLSVVLQSRDQTRFRLLN